MILTEKAKLFAVKPLLDVSLSHVQQSEEDKKVVSSMYRLHPLTVSRASMLYSKWRDLRATRKKKKKNNPGLGILFITVVFFTLGVVQFEGYFIEQLWMSE